MKRGLRVVPLLVLFAVAALESAFEAPDALRLVPERAWEPPSARHLLGCGELGVDLLALVSRGVVSGVLLSSSVAMVGALLGATVGAAFAMKRGIGEMLLRRLSDLLQAFPSFLLAMTILSAVKNPGPLHLAFVFLLTAWAPFSRLAMAETAVLRSAAFVEASFALGAGRVVLLFRHVLPNLLGLVSVQVGATASTVLVSEAALSFIGFGNRSGTSLGLLLDQGVHMMLVAPHVLIVGALAIVVSGWALLWAGTALSDR